MKNTLIIWLFLPVGLWAQADCELRKSVDSLMVEDWKIDTAGALGKRNKFYKKYFYNLPRKVEAIPLKGTSMACVQDLFGAPNKIHCENGQQTHIYYIWVKGFIENGKNIPYEALTLEIIYKNGMVSCYTIMINCG